MPRCGEPDRHGCTCVLEDRARRDQHPASAQVAPEAAIAHTPTARSFAARANETVRIAKPLQVVGAGGIIREPSTQLGVIAQVVSPGPQGPGRQLGHHHYLLYQPHSDGHHPLFNHSEAENTSSQHR